MRPCGLQFSRQLFRPMCVDGEVQGTLSCALGNEEKICSVTSNRRLLRYSTESGLKRAARLCAALLSGTERQLQPGSACCVRAWVFLAGKRCLGATEGL